MATILAALTSKYGFIGMGFAIAFVLKWIGGKLPAIIQKQVTDRIGHIVLDIKNPDDKELALAIVKWVEKKIPDQGAGKEKFMAAAAILTAMIPALKGQEAQIEAIIENAVEALNQGLKDAQNSK